MLNKKKQLEDWQHVVVRHITVQHIRLEDTVEGDWKIPDRKETMKLAGLPSIREVMQKKRTTVKKYLEEEVVQYPIAIKMNVPYNRYWWNREEVMELSDGDSDMYVEMRMEMEVDMDIVEQGRDPGHGQEINRSTKIFTTAVTY